MKKYKLNYVFTVMFHFCNWFLALIPGSAIIWGVPWRREANSIPEVVIFELVLILFLIVLGNVIHFFISLSKEHTVFIDEATVTVKEKDGTEQFIKLDSVKQIGLNCGLVSKHGETEACSISLNGSEQGESMEIKNPSFFLICTLLRRCKNYKLKLEGVKAYLLICVGFSILMLYLSFLPK
jgi:hypothetical protein